jgi:hypothetical protein
VIDAGVEAIGSALRKNMKLSKLNLGMSFYITSDCNGIHTDGANAIGMMLQTNRSIVTLELCKDLKESIVKNKINDEGMKSFVMH